MNKFILILLLSVTIISCSSGSKNSGSGSESPGEKFNLTDFYSNKAALKTKVESVFNQLSERQKVAQMIVQAAGKLGKPDKEIDRLIQARAIGGVLLLNGSMDGFTNKVDHFDSLADKSDLLPLIYSADAEPSLIYRKIEGSTSVPKTNELKTIEENKHTANVISQDLKKIGILYNYAPVLDLSPNNEAIKNRSYSSSPDSVIELAGAFASELQRNGIAATAKHFPGHGLVKGDTHSKLVFIDGDMKEVDVYKPFIRDGIVSVMVGHIAVRNNERYDTDGLPASCSKKIVTGLLRNELGFQGIITTDAMNMGALKEIPNVDFLAVQAGVDMVLMPGDEEMLIAQILNRIEKDDDFRLQIYDSVKRIIRLKICLGIIN